MKSSIKLVSSVSLLVLLNSASTNLWAMTNEGADGQSSTATTTAKGPDDKKDKSAPTPPAVPVAAPAKARNLWSFWGPAKPPQDHQRDVAPAVLTPEKVADAVQGAENLKEATLKMIEMTREDFEKADIEALRVKLETEGLSDEQVEFLENAISAREQNNDLLLTASQLVQASQEKLQELKKDSKLTPEIQELVSSALGAKQQGGTQEEQAARVVAQAQASSEWGWGSTVAYYTLGAPVTLPYEALKGLYNVGAWAFSGKPSADPVIPVVDPLPTKKANASLPQASSDPVVPVAAADSVIPVVDEAAPTAAEETKAEPKKLSRQQRRTAARTANKQRDAEQKRVAEAQRAENLAKLRARLKK